MKNFIITGSSGFLGRKLIERLSKEENVNIIEYHHNYNLENFILENKSKEIDCLYILGWNGPHGQKLYDFDTQISNIIYFNNFLEKISELKIKKIFFSSTVQEIASIKSVLKQDNLPRITLYGSTKLYVHSLIRIFCEKNNIKSCFAFISSVYGPGDITENLLCSSIQKLLIGSEKLVFSKGDQLFDFVYIDDVIEDLSFIGLNSDVYGQFLIGSGEYRPLRVWLEEMCDVFNKNSTEYREFSNMSGGSSLDLEEFSFLTIEFLNKIFNIKRTDFKTGIKETTKFLKLSLD